MAVTFLLPGTVHWGKIFVFASFCRVVLPKSLAEGVIALVIPVSDYIRFDWLTGAACHFLRVGQSRDLDEAAGCHDSCCSIQSWYRHIRRCGLLEVYPAGKNMIIARNNCHWGLPAEAVGTPPRSPLRPRLASDQEFGMPPLPTYPPYYCWRSICQDVNKHSD